MRTKSGMGCLHLKLTNMKSILKFAAFVLIAVVVFASCKKESDNNISTVKTIKELLTSGTWKYTANTVNPLCSFFLFLRC